MITLWKKTFYVAKLLYFGSSAMMGLSAVMFAFNLATGNWWIAAAWFNAGMAWIIVQLKDRSLIAIYDLCNTQHEIIVTYHIALVKGGIILEEAPEKEEGPAP